MQRNIKHGREKAPTLSFYLTVALQSACIHAICLHILVFYTVIDCHLLPPFFISSTTYIQEVKAPAPLAMARE